MSGDLPSRGVAFSAAPSAAPSRLETSEAAERAGAREDALSEAGHRRRPLPKRLAAGRGTPAGWRVVHARLSLLCATALGGWRLVGAPRLQRALRPGGGRAMAGWRVVDAVYRVVLRGAGNERAAVTAKAAEQAVWLQRERRGPEGVGWTPRGTAARVSPRGRPAAPRRTCSMIAMSSPRSLSCHGRRKQRACSEPAARWAAACALRAAGFEGERYPQTAADRR